MTDAQGSNAIVWFVAGGALYGVDAETGMSVLSGASLSLSGATVKPHQTPMIANGRVFVGSDSRIYALTP
jgi:outer membrane protein assembly factor BamB